MLINAEVRQALNLAAQKVESCKGQRITLWVLRGRDHFNTCSDKDLMEEMAFQRGGVRRGSPSFLPPPAGKFPTVGQ